jgi:hypothetical protein
MNGPDESSGAETFPEGWQLGAESWNFHRQFFFVAGRPTRQGEYSAIIAQIRYKLAEPLDRHYWRVKLADGTPIVVKGGWMRMLGVEAADYVPRPRKVWFIRPRSGLMSHEASAGPKPLKGQPPASAKHGPSEVAPPAPTARAAAPRIAEPPPRQPLRASTLTLGNPAAARVLAERLRRAGIPVAGTSP